MEPAVGSSVGEAEDLRDKPCPGNEAGDCPAERGGPRPAREGRRNCGTKSSQDHPALVGHELSPKDYIDAIFGALPSEYETFITSINSHIDSYTIDESWNTGKKKFGDFSNNPFGGFDSQYGQGQGFFSSPSSFRGNLNFTFNKNSHNCNRGRGNGQFGGRGRHGSQYGGRGS
ncbi:hypothetical protein CK203_112743 [Vitis vinifera]|uniref:Uncharacterized protein n=1 Tax=Vitis vinifera TaxID=29760 RepID=A0A438CRJ7_VITVI|nr:hypothetical protein CK203_112743 [Vitis vinifera]